MNALIATMRDGIADTITAHCGTDQWRTWDTGTRDQMSAGIRDDLAKLGCTSWSDAAAGVCLALNCLTAGQGGADFEMRVAQAATIVTLLDVLLEGT